MTACTATKHAKQLDGIYELEPSDLRHVPNLRIIDVREPSEFDGDLGHIPNAELVPLATIPAAARSWDRDTAMVVVCRSGRRSAAAARILMEQGFGCVLNLRGGMTAYAAIKR